jgi:membrane peptidoglycan carboxypeptidase
VREAPRWRFCNPGATIITREIRDAWLARVLLSPGQTMSLSLSRLRQHASSRLGLLRRLIGRHRRATIWAVAASVIVLTVVTVSAARFAEDVLSGLPGRPQLERMGQMAQATTLYDAFDQPVFTLSTEDRIDVPLGQVSPHVIHAILATEDQRFFEHGGVDPLRLIAAAWADLLAGRAAQGGSTLTQQLARQAFL